MRVEQVGGRPQCACGSYAFGVVPGERWPERNDYDMTCCSCGAVMLWRDPMPLAEVVTDPLGGFEEAL